MKVGDVMTRDVITVAPGASIHAAAQLMVDHGISGLPVVDEEGALIGIISEGDLIVRQKPREWPRWWQLFFVNGERLAREYQKAMGITVQEVMTRSVVFVSPDAPLASAAALLDTHRIRRLPVLSGGVLAGIVSRGDLVKALAMAPSHDRVALTDAQLAAEMKRRMRDEPWVSSRNLLIEARDGIIGLWGFVESETERSALETMARSIPGCRGIDSRVALRPEMVARFGAV